MAKETAKNIKRDAVVVKSVDDLQKELETKRADLLEAKRSNKSGELVNPRVITAYRKDVARLLTEINEKRSKA